MRLQLTQGLIAVNQSLKGTHPKNFFFFGDNYRQRKKSSSTDARSGNTLGQPISRPRLEPKRNELGKICSLYNGSQLPGRDGVRGLLVGPAGLL